MRRAYRADVSGRWRRTWAEIETELRDKHFKRKHGPNAYYGQKKKP